MTPAPAAPGERDGLRAEAAHLRRANEELLATVAELRTTVERQQVHIDRLVRMTFGRRTERVDGPTLFDGLPDPGPTPATTSVAHSRNAERIRDATASRARPPPAAG